MIHIFQNTFTGTTWLPDGAWQDITEQNPYVPTVGAVVKNLTVKFFKSLKKIKAHKKNKILIPNAKNFTI